MYDALTLTKSCFPSQVLLPGCDFQLLLLIANNITVNHSQYTQPVQKKSTPPCSASRAQQCTRKTGKALQFKSRCRAFRSHGISVSSHAHREGKRAERVHSGALQRRQGQPPVEHGSLYHRLMVDPFLCRSGLRAPTAILRGSAEDRCRPAQRPPRQRIW